MKPYALFTPSWTKYKCKHLDILIRPKRNIRALNSLIIWWKQDFINVNTTKKQCQLYWTKLKNKANSKWWFGFRIGDVTGACIRCFWLNYEMAPLGSELFWLIGNFIRMILTDLTFLSWVKHGVHNEEHLLFRFVSQSVRLMSFVRLFASHYN